jgi:nucleoside-triphosphatase
LKKNIFLIGAPSSGKTSVIKYSAANCGVFFRTMWCARIPRSRAPGYSSAAIKKIILLLPPPVQGFYIEEERIGDRRVGFLMKSLDGRQAYLAHQDILSEYRIRRYGVSIKNIEGIAAASIIPQMGAIIILDEIGKMECFSELFRETVLQSLSSPNIVLGTITLGGDKFIKMIKKRNDIETTDVTPENRNALLRIILNKIQALRNADCP